MSQGSVLWRRTSSARVRLVLLALSVLVPIVAFAGAGLWRYSVAEHVRHSEDALVLSSRVSTAVDREIDGLKAALEVLATSPALQRDAGLAEFDARARAVLRTRGTYVAMRDRSGQQLINTSRPFGTALPVTTDPVVREADDRVFRTGETVVSDLYTGAVTGLPLVLIDGPVKRGDEVAFALNIALDPKRLAALVADLAPPDWTIAIVDRSDRIIARSRDQQRFMGSLATPDLRAAATGQSGTWEGRTLEGTAVLGAYTRSAVTGWRVAVGVPRAVLDGPLRRLVWSLLGGGLLVIGLSVVLASRVARGISRPLSMLSEAARRLGADGEGEVPVTGLREADAVGRALAAAGQAIQEREAALRSSEEQFRAAVRAVEGVVWTTDAEGRVAGEQPGWAALTGQSPEAYDGEGWSSAIHPDDVRATLAAWRDAIRGKRTFVSEHRVRTADGAYRIFSVRAVPVFGPGNDVRGWVGVHTDVTEARTARLALAESRARLKAVFDAAPVGLVIAEAPSGRIVEGNAQSEAIMGHPIIRSPDVGSYQAWSALHPDGSPLAADEYPLARVIAGGEERPDMEVLYQRGDGRRVWVRLVGAPIRDRDGRLTGAVVAVLDIDAQRRAEDTLRDFAATLERRVESTIAERDRIWRLSTELMLVARFDSEIVAVNPAWEATLGWSENDLLGRSFVPLVHPDDVGRTLAEAASLSEGITTLHFENRYRHKDGSYRWLSWTAVPDAGRIHAIARDITAEREASEALRRTEEQLRQSQKMDVVGQLTGGVAHDFNNLLTVVTGHLDMARHRLERDGGDPRIVRNVAHALEGAQRAATLTHRLLAFSRQSPLRPEVVDLNHTVGAMSDLIRRTIGEHIEVRTTLADRLWPVAADPNQIESAVLNLCVNARDAMPEGGTLTIETANAFVDSQDPVVLRGDAKPGAHVIVSVTDTGQGMAPEVKERAFEPFFTTKPVGKGTGLGLSQVYGFLKQSGGHVVLHSTRGRGSTVQLFFPRGTAAAPPAAPAPAASPAVEPGRVQGQTVLVVEDEPLVRDLSVAALAEAGYCVIAAGDGPSGLALLEANPDAALLFTDVVLAGPMNGRAVADEALRRRPDLKVLFTTGYARDAIIHDGRLDEGVNLLAKPFTAATLVERVRSLLGAG